MGRGNIDNLHVPTSDEAREIGRRGGKASGTARRNRKMLSSALDELMTRPVPESVKAKLAAAGFDTEDADYQLAVLAAQIIKALNGDTRAAYWISDVLGARTHNVNVLARRTAEAASIRESAEELEKYFDERGEV